MNTNATKYRQALKFRLVHLEGIGAIRSRNSLMKKYRLHLAKSTQVANMVREFILGKNI